jgi:hypothetical protein
MKNIAFFVQVADEDYEDLCQYTPEIKDKLKKELIRQIDECEYHGVFNKDQYELLKNMRG